MPVDSTRRISLAETLALSKRALVEALAEEDPAAWKILRGSGSLSRARGRLFEHLNRQERQYFNVHARSSLKNLPIVERHIAKQCIRVLKNLIRTENERLTGVSALKLLRSIAKEEPGSLDCVAEGFLLELASLFRGAAGRSGILLPKLVAEDPAARSARLDGYAEEMAAGLKRFHSGLAPAIVEARRRNALRILKALGGRGASWRDWRDWNWQIAHLLRGVDSLRDLVKLEDDERAGLEAAARLGIPVQITPYYLSLFNRDGRVEWDRALRAQVLPSVRYCETVAAGKAAGKDLDFMGERATSPAPDVSRRYPQIAIFKPYNSCPQLCVYCQRNWEVADMDEGRMVPSRLRKGLTWLRRNESISEVILTGGDPLSVSNAVFAKLLKELVSCPHIKRVRVGTRTLATLPFRFDKELVELLASSNVLGERELCVVTHFESASELTPDALDAIRLLKRAGLNVYNQQVFTYYTSRRFESCHLRKALKLCGVDPYYTFNAKGKDETLEFRVPIARIEQERKEEARLLPGLERTDEPVFNVPMIGKSHLRAWQDHEPVMIRPDGSRVYRFYPWEASLRVVDDYLYSDVSIYDYLKRLRDDGERVDDYASIWYYF